MPLNEIFGAIKEFCQKGDEKIDVSDCHTAIQSMTQIQGSELYVYLEILENMKVIRYADAEKKSIILTEMGKRLQKLPSSMSSPAF
ncbi:MAG TPA: hypothetical protein VN721_05305 [Flavipsychrobacter sp.]|nr:hypothetical protein [Flavipsychrobacter sp.]